MYLTQSSQSLSVSSQTTVSSVITSETYNDSESSVHNGPFLRSSQQTQEELIRPKCVGLIIDQMHKNFPFLLLDNDRRNWAVDLEKNAIHTKNCYNLDFKT